MALKKGGNSGHARKPREQLAKASLKERQMEDVNKDTGIAEIAEKLPDKPRALRSSDLSETMAAKQQRVAEMIAQQIALLQAAHDMGRIDLYNTEMVWDRCMDYMQACMMRGHIPSMMELAVCFGYTWRGLTKWISEHPNTQSAEMLNLMRDSFTDMRNGLALEKVADNIMSLYLSNNSGTGLSNDPGEVAEKTDPLSDYRSASEVRKKYENLG